MESDDDDVFVVNLNGAVNADVLPAAIAAAIVNDRNFIVVSKESVNQIGSFVCLLMMVRAVCRL